MEAGWLLKEGLLVKNNRNKGKLFEVIYQCKFVTNITEQDKIYAISKLRCGYFNFTMLPETPSKALLQPVIRQF